MKGQQITLSFNEPLNTSKKGTKGDKNETELTILFWFMKVQDR